MAVKKGHKVLGNEFYLVETGQDKEVELDDGETELQDIEFIFSTKDEAISNTAKMVSDTLNSDDFDGELSKEDISIWHVDTSENEWKIKEVPPMDVAWELMKEANE